MGERTWTAEDVAEAAGEPITDEQLLRKVAAIANAPAGQAADVDDVKESA